MKKVALVTVNFNTEKDTHTCLDSIFKINVRNIDLTIIVVDNGSISPFILTEKEKEKNVNLLLSSKNLGFSGGYNLGIKKALNDEVDYICLLNNDTYVDENFLEELLTVMESNNNIGLVSPKIYFAKGHEYHKDRYVKNDLGHVIWYAGGFTDWNNVMSIHRGVDEVDHGQYDTTEEIGFASGCCMFFSQKVLEQVRGFDDRYFLYYEDADINERVKKNGYKIFYAPQSLIWHVNASSSGVGSFLHDYFLTRNRMLFGMTYAPMRTKIALLRESIRLLFHGRKWQKIGVRDYYLKRFGKGSYHE